MQIVLVVNYIYFNVIGVSTYDLTSSYWGVCDDVSTFHHEFKLEIEKKIWKNEYDIAS